MKHISDLKKLSGLSETSYGETISKSATEKHQSNLEVGSPEWFRAWFDLPYMKKRVNESDEDHAQALEDTGFWGRAGAGCIFLALDTGRILLNHRSNLVEQPGTWGVWGGAIDSGESPIDAVKREAQEESGQRVRDHQTVPVYVFHDTKSGFKYFNFVTVVDHEFTPNIPLASQWETQGWGWFDWGDWPSPLHFGVTAIINDSDSVRKISHLIREG